MIKLDQYNIVIVNETENRPISLEDLYQHFKERFISEVRVVSPELLESAGLVDLEF